MNKHFFNCLCQVWQYLNGDAKYQRYLTHRLLRHSDSEEAPLSRKAFFAEETRRKWSGVKRCC
jgi:uncharacterized short protein YbdD (DUF466 family)